MSAIDEELVEQASVQQPCPAVRLDPVKIAATDVVTPRKTDLLSKLSYSRKCLSRARVALFRSRRYLAENKQIGNSLGKPACSGLCNKVNALPGGLKRYIVSQVDAACVSRLGMRWSQASCSRALL